MRTTEPAGVPPADETPAAERPEPITAVSLAWLPAGDHERALDLWPDRRQRPGDRSDGARQPAVLPGGCRSNSPRLASQDWRPPRSAWHPSLPGALNRVEPTRRRPAPVCRTDSIDRPRCDGSLNGR